MHKRNCAVNTLVETKLKEKKIKTGGEYFYYIPREITLSQTVSHYNEPPEGDEVFLDSNQMHNYVHVQTSKQ